LTFIYSVLAAAHTVPQITQQLIVFTQFDNLTINTISRDGIAKCGTCGLEWRKEDLIDHHLPKKLYWCQMCSTQHIFTPHKISDFAPFDSIEKANAIQEEIQEFLPKMYYNHKGYWRN
jgi:hypothetical protein